jgi:hypothetical protein
MPETNSSPAAKNTQPPTHQQYHIHKKYIAFGIGSSFLLFYLLIVVLVITASLEKNKELFKLKSDLAVLNSKYAWLETQLNTEKSAKATIEKALDTVQKAPNLVDYLVISETPPARIGELYTPFNDQNVSRIAIKSNFAQGANINVIIYAIADPENVEKAVKIGETQVAANLLGNEKESILSFERPVELFGDSNYFIVVSTSKDAITKAGIGYTKDDTNSEGLLYKYSASAGWESIAEQDLYFRLE